MFVLLITGNGFGAGVLTYKFGRIYIVTRKYSMRDRLTIAANT
jgi:hypothetical protein